MKLSIVITLFFSLSAYGNVKTCYTQGDCQTDTAPSTKCFIAITGTDISGETTCALRCIQVKLGQYCQTINDEVFGYCKEEGVPSIPIFNPSDPNHCDNAVEMFP